LKIDAPADLVAFLDRHRSSWLLPGHPSRTFLEMSLAIALQRLGRFPQALRVLCDLYQREPFHPKLLFPRPAPLRLVVSPLSLPSPLPSGFLCTDSLTAAAALFVQLLFALFGSGVLTPEDELRLLRETKFDDSQLWARHLAVALLSAARDETPEAIWAQISSSSASSSFSSSASSSASSSFSSSASSSFSSSASSSSSSASSSSSSASSSSSFSASPPRPPGLYAVPLAVGLDGRCLRVDDVLSYVEEMYPSRHIPPEFIYSSVNLTIQAIRAFRRRNAPLAFALCTLYVSPALRLLSLSFFTVSDSDVDRV
ncbi:hypothetical protein TGDOM2_400010, partial [Toxoplasma gondii GAB2-2007-GAL-DOM2]